MDYNVFLYQITEISEAFSEQLHIDDIDTQDADNPQLCAEYAKDIYQYMRDIEVRRDE